MSQNVMLHMNSYHDILQNEQECVSPPAGWGMMLTSSMIPMVNTVSTSLFP